MTAAVKLVRFSRESALAAVENSDNIGGFRKGLFRDA